MRNEIATQKNDKYAEDCILGVCILQGTETFARAKQYIKTHEIFYNIDNMTIWAELSSMYEDGTPIDMLLLNRRLIKSNGPKSFSHEDWFYLIAQKTKDVVSDAHLSHWCLSLVEDYIERIGETALNISNNLSSFEKAKQIDKLIKTATEFKNIEDWADMSQMGLELLDRRERIRKGEVFGVKTGFRDFDLLTGGIEAGLIVIAARPSMGKTAFATSLAVKMASMMQSVGIISLEMPKIQLAGRIISMLSNEAFWRVFRNIHNGANELRVDKAILESASMPIYVADQAKVNMSDIRYKTEKLIRTKNAKCIIIDYIQLVNTNDDEARAKTREREVAKLSQGLKAMSKDLNIPVIALAQLNRDSEKADGPSRPGKLSQLRESDAILADADMGIIVDRPFKRGELTTEDGRSTENMGSIIIEKFRNGATDIINLDFNDELMMFMDSGALHQSNQFSQINDEFKVHNDFSTAPILKPFG